MKENTAAFLLRLSQEFDSTSLKTAIQWWDAIQAKCPGMPEPSACFHDNVGEDGIRGSVMFCWDTPSNHLEIDCRGEVVEWFYLNLKSREVQSEDGITQLTEPLIVKLAMFVELDNVWPGVNKRG